MKRIITILALAIILSSCSATRSTQDRMFYRGYVIKANGERKQKIFLFGRTACQRKNERIRKRRARMSSTERHPGYGITSMGRARQRR